MVKAKKARARLRLQRLIVGALVVVCLVVAGLLVVRQAADKARPVVYKGPVETIRTGLIGEYASLILIAQQQGYFADNGLKVNITEYASGPDALSALLAGKLDTAMASEFAGVSDSFHGEDLRILATLSKSQAFRMVVRKDRGIATAGDLRGKTIGITPKTVGEFYVGQFLTFNNLTLHDVRIVDMPQKALADALAAGTIDAAVLFEPNAYHAKLRLGTQALSWSVQSGQSIYSTMYGTNELVQKHPQALERYMRALVEAEVFVKAHNALAKAIIAQRLGYDTAYINYIWPRFQFEARLDQELLLNMDDEARWAIENHLTTASQSPNYLDLVYMKALEAVKPEGITIIH